MQQFSKVLVYVPTSQEEPDPAVKRAARLVRNTDAEMTVVTVMGEVDDDLNESLHHNLDLRQIIREQLEKRLEEVVADLRSEGLTVRTKLLEGSRVVALTREVLDGGYDLLLKTTRPEEDSDWSRFSSLALQLTRKCPCAVWIVQPEAEGPVKRVLAAVEPARDAEHEALNHDILALAQFAADCDGAELHVVHVWHAYGERVLHIRLSDDDVKAYADASRAQAEKRLEGLLDKTLPERDDVHCHLPKGDPGRVIPQLAKDKGIDLVVMGTVARSGVAGLLMGNTAEKTVRRLHCSLLTVKPEGFVSPVETARDR